jgi:hypothetical protein
LKAYHYCAMAAPSVGHSHYASGTVQFGGDLMTDGEYTRLCNFIGASMKPPRSGADLVLISLSVIDAPDLAPMPAMTARIQ